jgi:ferritin-like metal-binding protein YciE
MGIFTKDIKTLDDLFVHTLRDIYYAEKRILKALPEMIGKATDDGLKEGLTDHLEETRVHVTRLEQVFQMHGAEAKTVNCPAIDGIIKEAEEISADIQDKDVLDAAIIASAQAVEHYEITRYGTLIAWATQLGRPDCAAILEETLAEEKEADEILTDLAEGSINAMAEDGPSESRLAF